MKQNTLSIDFKFARVSGNVYTFGYDVYRSITASTEITVQNWNNKAAIPAYYDKPTQRLYAYGVSGYWLVFTDSLTFTSVQSDSERIDALETRVGSLETRVNAIVLSLNNAIIYRGVNGSTVSFSDAIAANLNNLTVLLTSTQSGSGDPSPTNIRPISGLSSVTVTRTGEDGANSQTVTVSLIDGNNQPLTVYGGTFDLTTGTLTVNSAYVQISSVTWALRSLYGDNFFVSRFTYAAANSGVSSCYPTFASVYQSRHVDYGIVFGTNEWTGGGGGLQTAIRDTRYSTVEEFVSAMGDQSYVIPTNPVTYQLTPQQLAALAGYNVIYASAGIADINVIYMAKITLEV